MEISTKWNYSRKASFSYVTVHSTDEPRIQAQYLEYSEDNVALMDGKPGFYSIDISTRGGLITLYLDHEHVEGLVEKLQQGMVDYTSVDAPVVVCESGHDHAQVG